jgi:hypothetical protein
MEKRIIYAAVSIMIFVFSPAHALTLLAEQNIDRVGCDSEVLSCRAQMAFNSLLSARMHVVLIKTVCLGILILDPARICVS